MAYAGQPDEGAWDDAYEDFRTMTPRSGTLSERYAGDGGLMDQQRAKEEGATHDRTDR